jgi:hypothetical protein
MLMHEGLSVHNVTFLGADPAELGPRIDAEGRLAAAGRACATVSAMLDRLGPPRG